MVLRRGRSRVRVIRAGMRAVRRARRKVRFMARPRAWPRGGNRLGIHSFKRTGSTDLAVTNSDLSFTNAGITATSTGSYIKLVSAGTANNFASFGWHFALDSVPNVSEFANLFDAYKIRKIVIRMIPMSNVAGTTFSGAPNANPNFSGFMHYTIDHDDAAAPAASEAGIDELRQFVGYKMKRIVGKGWSIVIKPRIAQEVFRSAITTAYAQGSRNTWLDMAYSDIPHYGLKGVFEGFSPNAGDGTIYIRTEVTYYFTLKGVR